MQLTEMLVWRSQAGAKLEASPSMASEYNSGRYSVLPRERERDDYHHNYKLWDIKELPTWKLYWGSIDTDVLWIINNFLNGFLGQNQYLARMKSSRTY